MTQLSLHDIIAPVIPLIADANATPDDLDWHNVDAAYQAARKIFPKELFLEDGQNAHDYGVEADTVIADENGNYTAGAVPGVMEGSRVKTLVTAAALIIATHLTGGGDAELEDIERATAMAKAALENMGIDADRIGLEENGLVLPDDLADLVTDPATAGWIEPPAPAP